MLFIIKKTKQKHSPEFKMIPLSESLISSLQSMFIFDTLQFSTISKFSLQMWPDDGEEKKLKPVVWFQTLSIYYCSPVQQPLSQFAFQIVACGRAIM